ncbi:unnamed protein product, partial [Meganyctiphanes norvegica]
GMRTIVTCLIRSGDQPITMSWQKDGQPMNLTPGVNIKQIDTFTSMLTIDSARDEHTGNYTCLAANSARTTTFTARLSVSVPPAWVTEPVSGSVALGGAVALHCLAKGFPSPTISWRKETVSGEFVSVTSVDRGVTMWP